jgi:hypothetical protein
MQKLRDRVNTHTKGGKAKELEKLYQECDGNGDGTLDFQEFKRAVRKVLKIPVAEMTDKAIMALFRILDEGDEDCVSLMDFTEFVTNPQYLSNHRERIDTCGKPLYHTGADRLYRLYDDHARKTMRLDEQRKEQEINEIERLETSKSIAQQKCVRQANRLTPVHSKHAAERLYQEHDERTRRLEERQRVHHQQEAESLKEQARKERPTRSASVPNIYGAAASDAGNRLFLDAERRERDRQQARDARDLEEQDRWTPRWERERSSRERSSSTRRHVNLYNESRARNDRLTQRRVAHEEEEMRSIASNSVPCGGEKRGHDRSYIESLHNDHAERQRRHSMAVSDKLVKEADEISTMHAGLPDTYERRRSIAEAEKNGVTYKPIRPPISDDPRSPRSVRSERRLQQDREKFLQKLEERKQKKTMSEEIPSKRTNLTTQADHLLNIIVQAIRSRCGGPS